MTEILKKITIAKVHGSKVKAPAEGQAEPLMNVYGIVRDAEGKEAQHGPYLLFRGDFEAVNSNGDRFRSGALIVPQTAENLLAGILGGDNKAVEFALEIGVKYDESAITNYTYYVKPLIENAETDPLESLRQKIKALPAPSKEGDAKGGKTK